MNTRVGQLNFLLHAEGDRSILWGVGISVLIVGLAVILSGHVGNYIDVPGFLLVVGGTLGATLANFSVREMGFAWTSFLRVIQYPVREPIARIRTLARVNQAIRAEGLLVLERASSQERDPFLRKAYELVVDGTPVEDIRRILETDMRATHDKYSRAVQVFETLGTYAPALGLIGTLVGLVQMLGALSDPSTVGPAMALALLTTLYGALLANLFFLPVSGKLRNRSEEEWTLKCIALEGAISMARQENTIVMEQRLHSFLPGKH